MKNHDWAALCFFYFYFFLFAENIINVNKRKLLSSYEWNEMVPFEPDFPAEKLGEDEKAASFFISLMRTRSYKPC